MLNKALLISFCLLALLASSISCSSEEDMPGISTTITPTGEESSSSTNTAEIPKNSPGVVKVDIDQLFENSDHLIGKRISVTGETLRRQKYGEEVRVVIGEVGRPLFAGVYKGNSELYDMVDSSRVGEIRIKVRGSFGRPPGDLITVEGIFLGINQDPCMMTFPYILHETSGVGMELEKITIP